MKAPRIGFLAAVFAVYGVWAVNCVLTNQTPAAIIAIVFLTIWALQGLSDLGKDR